ncbi:MAG: outer membrane beta-barrel protein [Rudaea sp.]
MKLTLIALAMAAAGLIATPTVSHAANGDNGGFFINGNVGQSNVDKGIYNDNDNGYGLNFGYRWAMSPGAAIGIEGGYTDLGKFAVDNSAAGFGLPGAKIEGWTAGVNGHFNVTPNWYLSGRAGLFRADVKGVSGPYVTASDGSVTALSFIPVDGTSNKYYAGVGFGYDFSNNASVGLNYDYYKANTNGLQLSPDLVSVSAEYRF